MLLSAAFGDDEDDDKDDEFKVVHISDVNSSFLFSILIIATKKCYWR